MGEPMVQTIRVFMGSRPHRFLTPMARQAEAQYSFDMPQCAGGIPSPSSEYRDVRMCGEARDRRREPGSDDSLRWPDMVLDRRLAMGAVSDVKRQVPGK